MDRVTVYRNQVPFESDILGIQRFFMEGMGRFIADVIGSGTSVGGLPCTPTSPASLTVNVGSGTIYAKQPIEVSPWGLYNGAGGLPSDTNADHYIMKQGLLRDTQSFTLTPPSTSGQSQVYLIEAQFSEVDDPATTTFQFWNSANPNAPQSALLSANRRCKCVLQLKAGTAATTGAQVAPAPDAGWVPVWAITVAYGQTAITAGNIAVAPGASFVSALSASSGSSGGGGTTTPTVKNWAAVTANYTATAGDLLVADTSGGAFTVTLPSSPTSGVSVVIIKGNFAAHNLTIAGGGASINLGASGMSSTYVLNSDVVEVRLVYMGSTLGWVTN